MRNLVVVLGDQLNHDSAAFDGFNVSTDAVWMAELAEETEHVWCHKLRIALFFSAMRHFREELKEKDITVHYRELANRPTRNEARTFKKALLEDVPRLKPEKLIVVQPGDYRVQSQLEEAAKEHDLELEIREDRHFHCTIEEFREFRKGRKSLLLETFYRDMRKRHNILLTQDGDPVGGEWNFDKENRETFGKSGPRDLPTPYSPRTDDITDDVIALVKERFAKHPGSLDSFDIAVKRDQARRWLDDFIKERLPLFGTYEDAMWEEEAVLYHSRLSALLNVKLLSPQECVEKAVEAYESGHVEINNVEGFVRQILGWREFVRGIYWTEMPEYAELNHFDTTYPLPYFYWTGETEMNCVKHAMHSVINHGYTHHIERLMVLGNLALTYGLAPYEFHEWHVAMYLDAIDWASLPNTLGMSQFGDGGIVGTKPYCSTGKYVNRMSNYCDGCRFDPAEASAENACPLTTFYWDFLDRNAAKLSSNHRMAMQLKNVRRKREKGELKAILQHAQSLRDSW
ncbi:cryptochrome/photolyase family protein [Calycomorphotria hydatis]|uniref:Deoxyribodipyrimidine photo-lyase-related protein n=1 Tax=Calycomorphotria hydatis TaxID=2528027 RepID=A0A517T909_9PLAN|nr:cryptochrome/photolyase family protein [Calycomorphotria hydatis]QDT64865.1 Deoxyribodipyrimidine photo-lyase-related protein [Calycomorphotria hydatis]